MEFRQFKMKTRANLAKTHYGPETLEEAVQDYINRNTDLVDVPGLVSVSLLFPFKTTDADLRKFVMIHLYPLVNVVHASVVNTD